ncbi:MAG: hypothetical protein ACHBN1_32230 [Heteroscytonema crispum UTEX LB 1556]
MKPNYNRQYIMLKLGLLSAGALLCLIPLLSLPSIAEAAARPQTTLQLAARNDCVNGISEGFSVETTNHYVGICYTNKGSFYVGHVKKGNARSILLPVSYNKAKDIYVAQNGKYTYTLDMKNNLLVIKLPNGRLSTEKVIRVIDS